MSDERTLANIAESISRKGAAAIIEVTNGLHPNKLNEKIKQAISPLKNVVKATEKRFPIYAGIIAFRPHENYDQLDRKPIDFFYQHNGYDPLIAYFIVRDIIHTQQNPKQSALAQLLIRHMENDEPLEDLLYPSEWAQFEKTHPELTRRAKSPRSYQEKVQIIKGTILERYTAEICRQAMPRALVFGPWKYSAKGDIDVLAVASPQQIAEGFSNEKFFLPIKPLEIEPWYLPETTKR